MKKNNFFIGIVCFLAVWSGILVTIFLGFEVCKMVETFVANIQPAFSIATNGGVVLCAMIASIFVAVIYSLVKSFRPRLKGTKNKSKNAKTETEN